MFVKFFIASSLQAWPSSSFRLSALPANFDRRQPSRCACRVWLPASFSEVSVCRKLWPPPTIALHESYLATAMPNDSCLHRLKEAYVLGIERCVFGLKPPHTYSFVTLKANVIYTNVPDCASGKALDWSAKSLKKEPWVRVQHLALFWYIRFI